MLLLIEGAISLSKLSSDSADRLPSLRYRYKEVLQVKVACEAGWLHYGVIQKVTYLRRPVRFLP